MIHSGNRYIVVFTDYFTKWPEAFAVPDIKAPRIAQLLLGHIIACHSAPRHLVIAERIFSPKLFKQFVIYIRFGNVILLLFDLPLMA